VMQTEAAIERIAYELVEDCFHDGVIRLEVRFSPLLHRPMAMELAVEAAVRGLKRGELELGVSTGLILCAIRNLPPSDSAELARVAAAYATRGVCGFDIAGPESGFPASAHQEAFDIAAAAGLGITVHAGESEGAWSVREAVEKQHAHRIGHGTHIVEDPTLIALVAARGVALEVCLQSNLETRSVSAISAHPFAVLLRQGVRVTLNTDNRLMSDTDLTQEYERATRAFSLQRAELRLICDNGVAASFVDEATRRHLASRVSSFFV